MDRPFVVMLIDGDSYRVSTWRPPPSAVFPLTKQFHHDFHKAPPEGGGARAALKLRIELLQVIRDSDICAHPRIVVRIFHNGRSGFTQPRNPMNGSSKETSSEFVQAFVESHPLLDFIDCGTGKERADHKIHENFELFLADPTCKAVFLAVCNDNGYVRVLEPYQFDPIAQKKVILVTAGGMTSEYRKLTASYRFLELPGVFAEYYAGKPTGKGTRRANVAAKQGLIAGKSALPSDSLDCSGLMVASAAPQKPQSDFMVTFVNPGSPTTKATEVTVPSTASTSTGTSTSVCTKAIAAAAPPPHQHQHQHQHNHSQIPVRKHASTKSESESGSSSHSHAHPHPGPNSTRARATSSPSPLPVSATLSPLTPKIAKLESACETLQSKSQRLVEEVKDLVGERDEARWEEEGEGQDAARELVPMSTSTSKVESVSLATETENENENEDMGRSMSMNVRTIPKVEGHGHGHDDSWDTYTVTDTEMEEEVREDEVGRDGGFLDVLGAFLAWTI